MLKFHKCKESYIEIMFNFKEDTRFINEHLEEIQIRVPGTDEYLLIGYQDLQDAFYKMGYDLVKR